MTDLESATILLAVTALGVARERDDLSRDLATLRTRIAELERENNELSYLSDLHYRAMQEQIAMVERLPFYKEHRNDRVGGVLARIAELEAKVKNIDELVEAVWEDYLQSRLSIRSEHALKALAAIKARDSE